MAQELRSEIARLKQQQVSAEEGRGAGRGLKGELDWYSIRQRICVVVPDDKRSVQEAVLQVTSNR